MIKIFREYAIEFYNKSSLRTGTILTVGGFGSDIIVRMISSLILTRIFAPEVFGVMAIITALLVGMELMSEVGVRTAIIQNKNGENKYFLDTAWTIQIIRGIFLWGLLYLITPYVGRYFNEPLLIKLLPIAGLVLVVRGFISVHIHVYSRALKVKRIVLMSIITQAISAIFTITLAVLLEDVLAIVLGSVFAAFLHLMLSFLLFPQPKSNIAIDKSVAVDIFHLAKWLFLASLFTFFVGNGDRLILGGLISKGDLGLYNLAAMFNQIPISILSSLSGLILLPYLAKSFHLDPTELSTTLNSLINKILNYMLPLVGGIIVFGEITIDLLYPSEFYLAGELLQLLGISAFFQILPLVILPLFLARGNSYKHMLAYLSIFVLKSSLIYLGFYLFQLKGAIYGVILAQLLWIPCVMLIANSYVQLNYMYFMKKMTLFLICCLFLSSLVDLGFSKLS
jgi:O-antigen/teichoic acid export membrane protein